MLLKPSAGPAERERESGEGGGVLSSVAGRVAHNLEGVENNRLVDHSASRQKAAGERLLIASSLIEEKRKDN